MKNLVIVESPSKSKTIEKYLGKDYKVMASVGHIRELVTRGKGGLGIDVENDFQPTYQIEKKHKDVVADLKKEVKKADNVYLATDPDREGEAISWHLAQVLDLDLQRENRIVFNEITRNAVLKALEEPRLVDMSLVHSQETRRMLDRIIGFKLSSLLQNKIHSKSAGRVQSIALRIICDREKEIASFVPEEYWTIKAALENDKDRFETVLNKVDGQKAHIANLEEAQLLLERIDGPFKVSDKQEKKKKRQPYLPFITSTLQQEASNKLGFTSRRTMSIAQSLYEGVAIGEEMQGLITYMRTDSTRLSDEFVGSAFDMIEKTYGKDYKGFYRVKNDEQSQDAHEAIRPTSLANEPEKIKQYLNNDQYKLYRFIYYRALASLMAPAEYASLTYTFENNGLEFTVSGSKQLFDGYLKVYGDYDSAKDVILGVLDIGDLLKAEKIDKEQHFTEGPSRYTEARLIKALEEEGVGRPSTYASIIETIQKRNYVEYRKENEKSKTRFFYPTSQGVLTDDKLREFFSSIINIKYTANMESSLDEIAEDNIDYIAYLRSFYDEFIPLVDKAYEQMEKQELEKTGEKCPQCGSDLVIRYGRFGKFISCSSYPACKYTANLPKDNKEEPQDIGRSCPECGKPLLKRKSRFGNYFIGCSNYPNCKYVENIEGEKKPTFRRKKK